MTARFMLDDSSLADFLLRRNLLSHAQVTRLYQHAQAHGRSLYRVVVSSGSMTEAGLVGALAGAHGYKHVKLLGRRLDPRLLKMLPRQVMDTYQVIPLGTGKEAGRDVVYVAMADPTDQETRDVVSRHMRRPVVPVMAGIGDLAAVLEQSQLTASVSGPGQSSGLGFAAPRAQPVTTGSLAPFAGPGEHDATPKSGLFAVPRTTGSHPAPAPYTSGSHAVAAPSARGDSSMQGLPLAVPLSAELQSLVQSDPARVTKALVRLLIRKGLVTEAEILEDLRWT